MDLDKKLQQKKNELYQASEQLAQVQRVLNSTNTRIIQLNAEINLLGQLLKENKKKPKEQKDGKTIL